MKSTIEIKDDDRVEIRFENGDVFYIRINKHRTGNAIEINSGGIGGIIVHPMSSNVIDVEIQKR